MAEEATSDGEDKAGGSSQLRRADKPSAIRKDHVEGTEITWNGPRKGEVGALWETAKAEIT